MVFLGDVHNINIWDRSDYTLQFSIDTKKTECDSWPSPLTHIFTAGKHDASSNGTPPASTRCNRCENAGGRRRSLRKRLGAAISQNERPRSQAAGAAMIDHGIVAFAERAVLCRGFFHVKLGCLGNRSIDGIVYKEIRRPANESPRMSRWNRFAVYKTFLRPV